MSVPANRACASAALDLQVTTRVLQTTDSKISIKEYEGLSL